MPHRVPLPEHLPEAFTVGDGLSAGLTRGRMRGSDLTRPFHAVRAPVAAELTVSALATVYSAKMPDRAYFSHVTAARLWDIPLPRSLEHPARPLDVSVPRGTAVPYGVGVSGHNLRTSETDIVSSGGLRITSPARTWCDLAALLPLHDLIAAGDSLLWWRRPASTRVAPAALAAAITSFSGRRGRPAIAAAVPRLSDRSDSRAESIIRCRIAESGLPTPEVNAELFDERGAFLAMPDLSWSRFRVCLDYEGDHHRTDAAQWEKDIARVKRLENANWLTLRAGRADLRDSTDLIRNLALRLRKKGWLP